MSCLSANKGSFWSDRAVFFLGDSADRVVLLEGRDGGSVNITHLSYMQAVNGRHYSCAVCHLKLSWKDFIHTELEAERPGHVQYLSVRPPFCNKTTHNFIDESKLLGLQRQSRADKWNRKNGTEATGVLFHKTNYAHTKKATAIAWIVVAQKCCAKYTRVESCPITLSRQDFLKCL